MSAEPSAPAQHADDGAAHAADVTTSSTTSTSRTAEMSPLSSVDPSSGSSAGKNANSEVLGGSAGSAQHHGAGKQMETLEGPGEGDGESLAQLCASTHARVKAFLEKGYPSDSRLTRVQEQARVSLGVIGEALARYGYVGDFLRPSEQTICSAYEILAT